MADEPSFDEFDIDPYDCDNPDNEPRPDHVVYHPTFANLQAQINRAVGLLRDTIVSSTYQSPATQALLEEVHKRAKIGVPDKTLFAICGDMGLGKSSLINSLLSTGTVARNGASGDSCTWVVQRFMKPFDGQTSPFAAKVFLFSPSEIRKIITYLVTKYTNAMEKPKQEDDEYESDEMTSDNFTERRTVLDIFKALFADREEFSDDDAAQEYLNTIQDEDSEVHEDLITWAMDLAADCLEGKECITVEASTAAELLYLLQPYTFQLGGEESEGQLSPWPLVNVVDFGLNSTLLKKGIVLVDTPGLSDSDSTRAKNAIIHHRQCTHKITVADVSRAKNDKTLRESLAQGYRLRGSSGTLLVLTKGDHIEGDSDLIGDRAQKERELELKTEIKETRDARTKLSRKHSTLRNREDKFDVEEQLRETSLVLKSKLFEYDHLRACMRNKAVKKAITDQYRELTGDPRPLAAFVVGNEAYKKHQAGHTVEEKPFLSVAETGIPDLRAYISNIPAEGELNDALHLANVQLPSLINYLELYCTKTHMKRKQEIEAIVLQPKEMLRDMLEMTKDKLRTTVNELLLKPMNTFESNWVLEARRLCRKWADLHRKESLQIMRKGGCKKGNKKRPEISWNRELLQIPRVKEDMEEAFRNLQDGLLPVHEELVDQLTTVLDRTRAKVRGDDQFNVMAVQPFLDSFQVEKPNMDRCLKTAIRQLREDTTTIQEDAMIPSASAFLVVAMDPIYKEVMQVKGGKGGPTRRMDLLERKVTTMSGVWMKIHDGIDAAFGNATASYRRSIERGMREVFDSIHRRFEMLCQGAEIKDPAEQKAEGKFRLKLQGQLAEARELLDGPIRQAVDECKGYGSARGESLFMGDD